MCVCVCVCVCVSALLTYVFYFVPLRGGGVCNRFTAAETERRRKIIVINYVVASELGLSVHDCYTKLSAWCSKFLFYSINCNAP